MRLADADLDELAELAVAAATDAATMIAGSRPQEVRAKPGATSAAAEVVTEIDRRSEDLILDRLAPTLDRYELGLLTEERSDDRSRLDAEHFWCVDPLDGTLPFVEGSPGYAVSIALVGRDGHPWIGVVVDPVAGTVWRAVSGLGTQRNGERWTAGRPSRSDVLSVHADRSFLRRDDHEALVAGLRRIAAELGLMGVELGATGGAVMNACRVLEGPPACYVKPTATAGGGSMWDFAATACLFGEAGAVVTDVHGDPLDLNRADSTSMHHRGVLFATDDALAERIRALPLA